MYTSLCLYTVLEVKVQWDQGNRGRLQNASLDTEACMLNSPVENNRAYFFFFDTESYHTGLWLWLTNLILLKVGAQNLRERESYYQAASHNRVRDKV